MKSQLISMKFYVNILNIMRNIIANFQPNRLRNKSYYNESNIIQKFAKIYYTCDYRPS